VQPAKLARLPMLEIAIALIVGFGLGYGGREWVSRRRRQAERRGRALWGPPPGRHLAVDLYCSGAGANITNHRIAAHSETTPGVRNAERCFFSDSYFRRCSGDLFQNSAVE